jgi:hypothetical protein
LALRKPWRYEHLIPAKARPTLAYRSAASGPDGVITGRRGAALNLRRGDDALAIIRSTEVMIARSAGVQAAASAGHGSTRK